MQALQECLKNSTLPLVQHLADIAVVFTLQLTLTPALVVAALLYHHTAPPPNPPQSTSHYRSIHTPTQTHTCASSSSTITTSPPPPNPPQSTTRYSESSNSESTLYISFTVASVMKGTTEYDFEPHDVAFEPDSHTVNTYTNQSEHQDTEVVDILRQRRSTHLIQQLR